MERITWYADAPGSDLDLVRELLDLFESDRPALLPAGPDSGELRCES